MCCIPVLTVGLQWVAWVDWMCWQGWLIVWVDQVFVMIVLTSCLTWLSWPEYIDKLRCMIGLTWTYWQSILHDWVDLKVLTRLATMSSASLSLINHSSWWQASVPANQARNSYVMKVLMWLKNSYIGYDQDSGKLLSKQNRQVAPEIMIGRELWLKC